MKCDMQEKRITYHNSCGSTDAHRHMATMLSALEDIFKYEKTQYVRILCILIVATAIRMAQ
jgi:ribulose bisphosphate carboxylase small subunit